jgi:hypothetical protein
VYCECKFSPIQHCLTLSIVEDFVHTSLKDGGWNKASFGRGFSHLGLPKLPNKYIYGVCCTYWTTVPFQLIWLSCVTGPPMAKDFWWIQKKVKKGFLKRYLRVWVMQHYFLPIYLRGHWQ